MSLCWKLRVAKRLHSWGCCFSTFASLLVCALAILFLSFYLTKTHFQSRDEHVSAWCMQLWLAVSCLSFRLFHQLSDENSSFLCCIMLNVDDDEKYTQMMHIFIRKQFLNKITVLFKCAPQRRAETVDGHISHCSIVAVY